MDKYLFEYLKKSFFTGTVKTVLVAISAAIFIPLVIQKIGMEKYGLVSMAMIFGGIVTIADLGMAKAVTLMIGSENDERKASYIFTNAIVFNSVVLIFLALALYLVIRAGVPVFGRKLPISNYLAGYIVIVGFSVLTVMLFNNLITAVLEARMLAHYANISFSISAVLVNAFMYFASMMFESIYLVIASPLLAFLVVSGYLVFMLVKRTNIRLVKPSFRGVLSQLRFSFHFMNIGIINSAVIPANKYVLAIVTGSPAILGLFDVSLKIAFLANSLLNSITQPLFGYFSGISKEQGKVFEIARKISKVLAPLYLLGIFSYFLMGNYIVEIIDKKNSDLFYTASLVLLIGVCFSSVSEPFYRAFLGISKLKTALFLSVVMPISNLIIFWTINLDSPLMRISVSYAIATMVGSTTILIYGIQYGRRWLKS